MSGDQEHIFGRFVSSIGAESAEKVGEDGAVVLVKEVTKPNCSGGLDQYTAFLIHPVCVLLRAFLTCNPQPRGLSPSEKKGRANTANVLKRLVIRQQPPHITGWEG